MRASTTLAMVLRIKIIVTVFFWSLPLLLLPESQLKRMGIALPEPAPLFARLLGAAFSALLLSYIQGERDLRQHKDITNTVCVGIVSNGLACMVLLRSGYAGTWQAWSKLGRSYMWLSTLLTGAFTVGLIGTGLVAGGAKAK